MLYGHGDDTFRFPHLRANFSSNICTEADLAPLKAHLATRLSAIENYPEPAADSLAACIARLHGIQPDEVLVTNGATDAIYLIAQAFATDGTYFSTDEPTFSEYADACLLFGLKPLTDADSSAAVRWLCNPNNPDGRIYTPEQVRREAQRSTWLVVDQSYEDYTAAPLLTAREALGVPNLLLLHSLTKSYAVPGLRIGYVTAPAPLIARLKSVSRPWAVNALAVEAGKWLRSHDVRAVPDLDALLAETQRLANALSEVPHLHVSPTATTFMLVCCDTFTAAQLKERLATEHGLLIRDASNFPTLTPHHFRVATQRPDQNDALVAALRTLLSPSADERKF